MAETSRRLRPGLVQADIASVIALQDIPDYAPANPAYAREAMNGVLKAMQDARTAEIRAENAAATARDQAQAAEADLHSLVIGLRNQIVAQYGGDSTEAQAVGLTRTSERKTPTRKPKPASS